MNEQKSRDRVIIRTSVLGILANILLASFKAFVGLMSNSVAIVMDAVNNISDAASSVITIVGTKLAGKEADKKHPFGYGRIEYISAMAISFLVLYAGITAFIESVKKITSPETPDYSTSSLVIVAVAVLVKIILGRYVKRVGEKVNSDSLVNSGEDATLDSVISASTLVAALIYLYFGLSLEAWLGAVIAAVIIKSGFEMLSDTLSKILGERADAALAVAIKKTIAGYPSVRGAYDLVLHNYGPDAYNGSVHIEVPDSMTAVEIDRLTRGLTAEVYDKYDVLLTGVGVYAYNTKDPDFAKIRDKVAKMVTSDPYVLQMHGFFLDIDKKHMRFDIVISFDAEDRRKVLQDAVEKVEKEFPSYTVQVTPDIDFSEILES
ncbi:MAG: cation transporter [Oscillospiraceae bacterium]|nr:cation transporter [Oscillospiraceae bacterium]